jgi:hypothetical protein
MLRTLDSISEFFEEFQNPVFMYPPVLVFSLNMCSVKHLLTFAGVSETSLSDSGHKFGISCNFYECHFKQQGMNLQ